MTRGKYNKTNIIFKFMTVDINSDIWSVMCKLEISLALKYSKESSRGNSFKDEMFPQSILSESWFIKYTGKSHFLCWSAA